MPVVRLEAYRDKTARITTSITMPVVRLEHDLHQVLSVGRIYRTFPSRSTSTGRY